MASFQSVGELVRAARGDISQQEFAHLLGVRQSSVSRYERGLASPPISVIESCMRMTHIGSDVEAPTAEHLATRVRNELAEPKMARVRSAISRLVDAFAYERSLP